MPKPAKPINPGDRVPHNGWEVTQLLEVDENRHKFWECRCLRCDRAGFRVRESSLRDGSSQMCRSCASSRGTAKQLSTLVSDSLWAWVKSQGGTRSAVANAAIAAYDPSQPSESLEDDRRLRSVHLSPEALDKVLALSESHDLSHSAAIAAALAQARQRLGPPPSISLEAPNINSEH